MNRIQIGILILVLLIAAGVYWFWGDIVRAPTHNGSGGEASTLMLSADAYPLYTGAAWGSVASGTLEDLVGVQVTSKPVMNITDIASTSQPFENYYRTKLLALGWSVDNTRAAGGAGADIVVYIKAGQYIATVFTTDFNGTSPDEPVQCPCDVTLSVFSGVAK
jgi:hypothetical protein